MLSRVALQHFYSFAQRLRQVRTSCHLLKVAGQVLQAMALSALCCCLSIGALAASEHPHCYLSPEEAVNTQKGTVHSLSWLGTANSLYATVNGFSETKEDEIKVWNISTREIETIGSGQYASVAPHGNAVVTLNDTMRQWELKSIDRREAKKIGQPAPFALGWVAMPPQWSKDASRIAIIEPLQSIGAQGLVSPEIEGRDDSRFIDVGRYIDERGLQGVDRRSARIRIVDTQGGNSEAIINIQGNVYYGAWHPDGYFYFVVLNPFFTGERPFTALRRLNVEDGEVEEVYRLDGGYMQSAVPAISPYGRYVALALDLDNRRWDDFVSLMLINLKSGSVRRLTTNYFVNEYQWAADGESLYFIGRSGGLDQIYKVDLQGNVSRISTGLRDHRELKVSPDGRRLSYVTVDGYGRTDIRVLEIESGEEYVVDIVSNPRVRFCLGECRAVRWNSTDDLIMNGFLILPPDFDRNREYPLFVDVHGGGTGAPLGLSVAIGKSGTLLEWHALAALGYVIFMPDMRSSGEYGPDVAAARYAETSWDCCGIRKDAEDIERGIEWLLGQGFIDANRIAIFGHSAGGARVNYLLTQSHIFSAAIIHDPAPLGPLALLIYRTTGKNAGVGFDENHFTKGVRFVDDPSIFVGGPLFDGYKSTTPTLIMVGNEEMGAMPNLSAEILFSMLRQYEVPTRMLRYIDDGHTPSTQTSALHRHQQIIQWLGTYTPASHR